MTSSPMRFGDPVPFSVTYHSSALSVMPMRYSKRLTTVLPVNGQ
jgi:hypothetical protein